MKNKYIVHNRPVDILMEWLPKTWRFAEKFLIHNELEWELVLTWKGFKKEKWESKIKLSEEIKETIFTNQMIDEEFIKYKH